MRVKSESGFESQKVRMRCTTPGSWGTRATARPPLPLPLDRAHVRQGGPEPVEQRQVRVRAPPLGAEPGLHVQGAAAGSESAGAQPGDLCVRVRIYIFKREK